MLHYGCRIIGLAALGPHMHFVGRKVDRGRTAAREELRNYREADGPGRKAIIDEFRRKLMEEASDMVKKAQVKSAGRSRRELERLAYLETRRYQFINKNTRTNVRVKYIAAADPTRSSARALSD